VIDLWRDLRYAMRTLGRSPGFTAVAVASLGLGIGATTTVFSTVSALYLRPLGFTDPDRLVDVHEASVTRLCAGCSVGTSYPSFIDWQREARSFEGMAAYGEDVFVLSEPGDAERVTGGVVSSGFFRVLGVAPLWGRDFRADDDEVGAPGVIVLSHQLFARRFRSDPRVVGQNVKLNGRPVTVIGVMPDGFLFPDFATFWVPLRPFVRGDSDRSARDYGVVARLAVGGTLEDADKEMQVLARQLELAYPESQSEWTARVVKFRSNLTSETGNAFLVLFGAVTLVWLIACANLASLLLARGSDRRREMAIRVALGAGRSRLIRHLLAESLVMSLTAAVLGAMIAMWGVDLVRTSIRTPVPGWIQFVVDSRVLVFCAALGVASGFVFGIVPAFAVSRPNLTEGLKEGTGTSSPGQSRQRARSVLVVMEIALALVLLAGAGLLIKTFLRVNRFPNVDVDHLLLADLPLVGPTYDDSSNIVATVSTLMTRVAGAPGTRVAAGYTGFIAGFGATDQKIQVEGLPEVSDGASPRFFEAVTHGYFDTYGLRLVRGRGFTTDDRAGAPGVVVINQDMANAIWLGDDPVGHRVKLGADPGLPWLTVVGVVTNLDGYPVPDRRAFPYAYVPLSQRPGRPLQIVVRTPFDPMSYAPTLRAEMQAIDPDEPVDNFRTVETEYARRWWDIQFFATFLSTFAGFALLLASIGTYGVVAYAVSQRTREIGIRVALGAARADVMRLVVGQGVQLAVIGTTVGVVGAWATTRLLRGLMVGADPADPIVFVGTSLMLLGVALLATYLPARRAARVSPVEVLRSE
jgi:putative ABC transport system permease protein